MIYQLTSAKEVIARVENNFDIDYSDWITRAPLWIADALDELQFISAYEDKKVTLTVENYSVFLPNDALQDIRRIQGVVKDSYQIERLNSISPYSPLSFISKTSYKDNYIIKNGFIVTSFEEGEIDLYYQTPAVEYDSTFQIYLPKVPINSIVQNAIGWYLIYCMLRKGHKHPTFNLDSNNPITNPYMMWEIEKKKAKNQGNNIDSSERHEISKLLRTFLIDTKRPEDSIYIND